MPFTIGSKVILKHQSGAHGIISEIVPPNAAPRTVRHTAAWRRPVESYVVTILTPRIVPDRSQARASMHTLGCRRIWPSPDALAPRERIFS